MQPGDVVAGRFRIEWLLGSGGMGEVWAATNVMTGRVWALKFLHKNGDARSDERLVREARAASAVPHPNVVPIQDVIRHEGAPVLVMELLIGESLRTRLDRDGKLSAPETVRLLRAILETLEAAHAAGVVHRDLKPDNVFLERDPPAIRLLDFGVAKMLHAEETKTLTESGATLGTPYYMAPEQAFGEPDVDGRADLWAAGVLAFECLTGKRPTQGDNLGQVMRLLATGAIPKLATTAPELPPSLSGLVDALLSIDRQARTPTARAALDALDGAPAVVAPRRSSRRWLAIGLGVVAMTFAVMVAFRGKSAPLPTIAPIPLATAVDAPDASSPLVVPITSASVASTPSMPRHSASTAPPLLTATPSASTRANNPLLTTPPF